MKATDLMIGDWVMNTKNEPVKVKNLGFGYVNMETWSNVIICSTHDFCVEPIPLTTEILEKNGYVFQDWWYEQKGYPDITNMFSGDKYEVGKHAYYGKGQPEFNSIIQIQYVHELQHALKLCGIEKEIKL